MRDRVELEPGKRLEDVGRCVLAWTPKMQATLERSDSHRNRSTEHVCRHAIDKLYGHVPLPPPKRAWFMDHANVLCKALQLSDMQLEQALQGPAQHREDWRDRLDTYRHKERDSRVREWKRSLEVRGQPTPKLFRWLRSQPPSPPLALRTDEGLLTGPHKVLPAFRHFWEGIMCRNQQDQQDVQDWLTSSPIDSREVDEHEIQALSECCKLVKKGTSAGLDGWPGEIFRILPKIALKVLRVSLRHLKRRPIGQRP